MIVDLVKIATAGTHFDRVSLCRWFNLMGMQFTLGHWEVEGSLDNCYTYACEVNVMLKGTVGDHEHDRRCQVLSSSVASIVSAITALTD